MKLGGIIEDYKMLIFSKEKDMFCENYELFGKLCVKFGF
jgi:hypothetical protein